MNFKFSKKFKSKFEYNFNLSKLTWFRTGGLVNTYCYINNSEDLIEILSKIPSDVSIFILGAGSNVLVRDGGFNGVVLKLGKEFSNISQNDEKLIIGSGVLDINLSKYALKNSISDLEFYIGIPGTLGGAIKMNAGCYGYETKNIVSGIKCINRFGEEKYIKNSDLNLEYRSSSIDNDTIIKEIIINFKTGNKNVIKSKMEKIIHQRKLTQPLRTKTSGSTFKNPKDLFAAKLIEDSGCKGMQVGGAMVSNKHANFFINNNNASAKDIEDLGKKVREKVFNKFSILLDWEIKIIGKYL